jgi:UDP-N-acetylmuramoylalanine--D-glutamate ligase
MTMQVAIIGGGIEGQAAARYWIKKSAEVTLHDRDESVEVPAGVKAVLGVGYLRGLNKYDLIVRSPGVKPSELKTTAPISSSTREFFKRCPARIIGVTGTKGKGTTSTLIAKLLEESGKRVWLGGNIGRSPLDFLDKIKASDLVVLELSSFQLMDLDVSPHIAVCLMVVAEHMDWHGNLREYIAAKGNLFWHQKVGDIAIYHPHNDFSTQIALLSPGTKIPYLEEPGAQVKDGQIQIGEQVICPIDKVGLLGAHNLENICAAVTAANQIVVDNPRAFARAIRDFKGLEHRLEFVETHNNIRYYDDSFSTTPETAIAAIKSFSEPKILILGGADKKSKYSELGKVVASGNVRGVILIGAMAQRLELALTEAGYTSIKTGATSMEEAVALATKSARSGDVILLSPACTSYDMFKNYKDRGEQFKSVVQGLAK